MFLLLATLDKIHHCGYHMFKSLNMLNVKFNEI